MLTKINRLQKKKDIDMVLKKGRKTGGKLLILKTIKNNLHQPRFAFLVSKKVSNKANIRNKVRRRLRELVKLKIKETKEGTDNLLIALPGLEKKDFQEIKKIVDKIF